MQNERTVKSKITLKKKITIILAGVFLSFVLLEIGLRLGGFIALSIPAHGKQSSIRQKGGYCILCFGECTTARQYPAPLEKLLNERNTGVRFEVIDKGVILSNTSVILSQIEDALDKYKPDMVITMAGYNDKWIRGYENIPEADTGLFRSSRTYRIFRLMYAYIVKRLKKEDICEKMVSAQLRASSDKEYTDIGYNYPDQGDTANSVVYYKKAIAITPRDDKAFFMLGEIRRNQGRPVEAEGYFKKAIELNPGNDLAYMRLGRIYCDRADRVNAGECFRKALGLRADYEWACSELAQIYMIQGDFRQAEILLREYTARNPGSGWGYKILGTLYKETGREDMAAECYKKLGELKEKDYESVTVHNYNKLKQILDKRKIKFVCVQYPLRSVEPLKEIFKDPKGIVFVDNQRVFAEAVKKDGYKEYFLDMFGGDFGHCTESGNSLLAENIADVILKEVFGKQGFPR